MKEKRNTREWVGRKGREEKEAEKKAKVGKRRKENERKGRKLKEQRGI